MGINAGTNPYNFANNGITPTPQPAAAVVPRPAARNPVGLDRWVNPIPFAGGQWLGKTGKLPNPAYAYKPSPGMRAVGAPMRPMLATMPMQQQANTLMNFRQQPAGNLNALLGQANPWMRGQAPQSVMMPAAQPVRFNPMGHLPF